MWQRYNDISTELWSCVFFFSMHGIMCSGIKYRITASTLCDIVKPNFIMLGYYKI